MRSLAAHVSEICYQAIPQFTLYPKTPLLRIWPNCFRGNSRNIKGKERAARRYRTCRIDNARTSAVTRVEGGPISDIANARIVHRKLLRHTKDEWAACFQ